MHRSTDTNDSTRPGGPPAGHGRSGTVRTAMGALALLVLGPVALSACGDDEPSAAADDAPTSTDPLAADPAAATEEFCDSVFLVDELVAQEEPEGDPLAALDAVADTAPAELSEDVAALVEDAKEVLPAGGDLSDSSEETLQDVYGFMGENCDAPTVSVTAVDYTYTDLPETIDAGRALLELRNEGTEVHEMTVVRINDDVTDTIDELVQLPGEEAMKKVSMVTGMGAEPGTSGFSSVTLEPGRYAVVCFLPEGSTPEAMEEGGEPEGQPHALLGMTGEFEVA